MALLALLPALASAQGPRRRSGGRGYLFLAGAPSLGSALGTPGGGSLQFGGGAEWLIGGVGFGGELFRSMQSGQGGASSKTWVGSADVSYHFRASGEGRRVEPFLSGGYSSFWAPGTGIPHANGGNLGGGLNVWLGRHAGLRLEVQDDIGSRVVCNAVENTCQRPPSAQHLVGFRVGVTFR